MTGVSQVMRGRGCPPLGGRWKVEWCRGRVGAGEGGSNRKTHQLTPFPSLRSLSLGGSSRPFHFLKKQQSRLCAELR